MPRTLFCFLALSAVLAACRKGDTAASQTANATTTATPSAAAAKTTAAGTVASSMTLTDSISQRADRGRIFGDSTATVWVIMASDFQCPFCKQWHDASFAGLMNDYVSKGHVRLAFLNYPLGQHPNAMPAAEAAMCASAQNKFWPMHEALFATQQRWESMPNSAPLFDSLATTTGLNTALYKECVTKHLTAPLIEADHDRAANVGVRSTPAFIVDGKVLLGADQDAAIRSAIDAALAKAGRKPTN